MYKFQKLVFAFYLLWLTPILECQASEYSVIINKNNNFSGSESEKRNVVKRLFLKKQAIWANGIKAYPINVKPNSVEYNYFLSNVLEMSEAEISYHWALQKNIYGEAPPKGVRRARTIFRLVAQRDGGVGYINKIYIDELPDTVKVLFDF